MRLLLVILLVMVACKAPSCRAAVAVSASAASWKVAAVQSAMQQMLDFEPSKESGGGVDGGPQKAGGHQATGYMVHLYRKYLASHKMKQDSSTIRSIGANFESSTSMSFNVNSVDRRREHVHSAQLHLFKKRTAASSSGVQLCAFTSAIAAAAAADQWQVSTGSHVGWQVYDVTAALISAASAPPPANQLLFHLESLNKTLPLDRILRTDPAPFLVVFSKDTTNQTWTPQSTPSSLIRNASASRKARSIDDNELPDLDSLRASEGDLDLVGPETGPSILKARPRGGGTNQKNKIKVTPGDDGAGSGIVTGSSNAKSTLSYRKKQSAPLALSHYNSGHGSRSRSRKPKRRHRKLPDTWHLNQQQHVNDARQDVPEDASRSLCQKRKLVVDFAEIGWGEWIISPKTFEAHYCAGRCPFPLTKELNPTNHATIQSIVHAIGTHPDVPAACCIPDVLSSLTLLYFDDNRNVVLKNYPSMTAETCACR